jgi:hypothetical protein
MEKGIVRPIHGLAVLAAIGLLSTGVPAGSAPGEPQAIVLSLGIRADMEALFVEHNRHWNELAELNTLEQLLGTRRPTQREYLGCLQGLVARDTVWVNGWARAEKLRQLQFAVTGSCEHVPRFIGTWHTHPYKADLQGLPVKQRGFSAIDLTTFAQGTDLVSVVVWDVDSLEAALRLVDGTVRHPVPLLVR